MPSGTDPNGMRVVVAFLDRSRDRGLTYEFKPYGDGFLLHPPEDKARLKGKFIAFKAIKAVYFVKTLEGNKNHKEKKTQIGSVHRQGRKVSIHFPDGEIYMGITEGFNPSRAGFFFYPGDPASNNLEVFVVTSNADEIRILGGDIGGGDKVFKPNADRGVFLPEKRMEAVKRVLRGETVEAVAKDYTVPPSTIAEWKAKFLSGGAAALGIVPPAPPPGPGAPGKR